MRSSALLIIALALLTGCGGELGPQYVPVRGNVTLDGKPLKEGEIIFTMQGEVPQHAPIRDGVFEGKAVVGSNKVQFAVYKAPPAIKGPPPSPGMEPSHENILPARYHQASTITKDVTATGPNEFTFELTAK